MTFRAARLSEEKQLAALRISPNRNRLTSSLENSQVAHHGFDLWQTQRAKRRHPRRRDSRPQDSQRLFVGQPLNFRARGDVGSALATFSVQAMTGGTNGFERFPAVLLVRMFSSIFFCGSVCLLRPRQHHQGEGGKE